MTRKLALILVASLFGGGLAQAQPDPFGPQVPYPHYAVGVDTDSPSRSEAFGRGWTSLHAIETGRSVSTRSAHGRGAR